MATTPEPIDWASPPKFDLHQFTHRARVVSSKSCISFDDYGNPARGGSRMHVIDKNKPKSRRLPTPDWVMDDKQLKEVILFYSEKRLYLRTSAQTIPEDWTIEDRLDRVQRAATNHAKTTTGIIGRLIDLHKSWTEERVLPLLVEKVKLVITGFDSDCVICQRGLVGTALAVTYFYYRLNFNATEIARELHLKPPGVRQILRRLNLSARQIRDNPFLADSPQKPSNGPTKEELACIAAGMSHEEYEYRREQIRAAVADRPLNTRIEIAKNSVAYGSIDQTELLESVSTGKKATGVRWDGGTRRMELIRGEMVAAPKYAPMW